MKKVEALVLIYATLVKKPKEFVFVTGKGRVMSSFKDIKMKDHQFTLYDFTKKILLYFLEEEEFAMYRLEVEVEGWCCCGGMLKIVKYLK